MKLKIICKAPKGKVEAAAKNFKRMFSLNHKPTKYKIVNQTTFYFIYDFLKEKDMQKTINKKLPKMETTIRRFYYTIIALTERANKISKKGAWKVEKARRWILNQLGKKGYDKKEMADFVDSISFEDKEVMLEFLTQELITSEVQK